LAWTSGSRAAEVELAAAAAFSALAAGFAPAPFSTVKMTWPTLSLSPSFTRISPTVPVTDDCLVGLEFHDRFAFGDGRPRLDHQADEIAAFDILA
jgi:hypothetical protein